MKTSTTLLIAAGAVVATVGIGSAVYADGGWRGPCREGGMRAMMHGGMHGHGMHGPGFGGPMGGQFGGMMGPMVAPMVAGQMFELADTDGDGRLTREEIEAARNLRFESHDADQDGKLTLGEFQALFAEMTGPVAVRVFQFLDPDGDAVITKAEFDRPTSRLVEHFDRDGDGVLSRDDRPGGYGPGYGPGRHGSGPRGGAEQPGPQGDGDN